MKKLILLITLTFFAFNQTNNAQDSKFYLGVGAGLSTAGGDLSDEYKSGLSLNLLNLGYRFNETWGITANLGGSGHVSKGADDLALGTGVLSIGPIISFPVGNMTWDLKPQLIVSHSGTYTGDYEIMGIDVEDIEYKGGGFVFGNSLVFGDNSKGFDFSIDLDYLSGKFNEISANGITADADVKFSHIKIGAGIRYNF